MHNLILDEITDFLYYYCFIKKKHVVVSFVCIWVIECLAIVFIHAMHIKKTRPLILIVSKIKEIYSF